ncbi:MAG: SDR family oxidoreductase, partial [Candidatus Methanofastidiosia archaeon]
MLLKGMKALVTGGSLGIGSAIVTTLAKEGSDVSTIYRKHDREVKEILRKVEMFGREGIALKADVSDFKKAQEVVNEVLKTFGKLDILVLNAGINWDSVIWKMTEEQWDRVIEVNLKGYFNYARAVVPIFKEQKFGKIVNITSINGLRGKFGQTNYSA